MPPRIYRSRSRSRCARTSSSNSPSGWRLPARPRTFAASTRSRAIMLLPPFQTQYAADHARDALPVFGLARQLLPAAFGDGVKLGFPMVFRNAPIGIDPALL